MLPNGNLRLVSVTLNMSGDYFSCEIGWSNRKSYNATYQIIVNNSKRIRRHASKQSL